MKFVSTFGVFGHPQDTRGDRIMLFCSNRALPPYVYLLHVITSTIFNYYYSIRLSTSDNYCKCPTIGTIANLSASALYADRISVWFSPAGSNISIYAGFP